MERTETEKREMQREMEMTETERRELQREMDRDGIETRMDREMERREMEREMERRGIGRREMEIEILRSETEREMEKRILRRWTPDLAPRNPQKVTRALLHNLAQTRPEPRHPRLAVEVHHQRIPVGIDLICNGCQHHVPGSQSLWISYRFYERNTGLPPVRCFADCPNCYHDWELLKLPGSDNKFALCAGATQHFLAAENVPLPTQTSDDGPLIPSPTSDDAPLTRVPPHNRAQLNPRPRDPQRVTRVLPHNLAQTSPGPQNPPLAVDVHHKRVPVGIDLICNGCQHHVPKSQELWISYRYYGRYTYGPPVRCFAYCLNCCDEWELILLSSDNKFAVYAGATQHFPTTENVPLPTPTSDDGPLILWQELRR
ncbi:hypothetical protein CASFOL_035284 [Castilleja foliolosa]|uniref:Uncharacterized protein n=1 Tax=Castilleja foliolosa TaxID=1961234 RepID=A0ABD3BUJ1_9LAMI